VIRGENGMGDGPNPVVQRRRLRAELRSARQAAGLTQENVAEAMDWSPSKIIRIEAGSTGISTNDLKALLALYKVVDAARTDELVGLARIARERSWWSDYKDDVSPRFFQFIEHEAAASSMRGFQPLMVPGLFQTEEYARTVIEQFAVTTSPQRVDTLIKIRMKRQELLRRSDAPLMHYVLDEAAIRRQVGGKAVMRRQILYLSEIAKRPNVTVEIVPFTAGVHPGMQGPFVILDLAEAADDDVLFLETARGDLIFGDDPDELATYGEWFEQLRKLSFGPDHSVTYLGTAAEEMT
jgi:transcriptional regulator with XRE-family HTH domain